MCPVMIDCSSRSAMTRSYFRYSPLYLTRYPILHSPVHCPTTHFRCLHFDDDDDDDDDDNDSDNGFFDTDRTRKKPPLRRLKNIGMASEKLYQNQP